MVSLHQILLITTIFLYYCYVGRGKPNTKEQYIHCSPNKYEYPDLYGQSMTWVIADLQQQTSKSEYNYYNRSPWNNGYVCYGHGTCNGALSAADCADCLCEAYKRILTKCENSYGAQLQLQDCRMRYEQYPFIE
ncbi:hypothetical protein CDL15_Pgr018468 [Punica granatum]|uniref:Gnk2-homologous domain-containing protein n=1 Tax=Punica granatum TaxID=22663 RepID=A0A218WZG1_PUNGR|nr:hypothetical protein CDL15_Pgr018468 [Punica granatum]